MGVWNSVRTARLAAFACVAVLFVASSLAAGAVPIPGVAAPERGAPALPEAPAAPAAPKAVDIPTVKAADGPGWGAPRAESLAPTATNEVAVLSDPEGDVSLFGIEVDGQHIPPVASEDAYVDIVSLTLLETDEAILFQLRHRGYPDIEDPLDVVEGIVVARSSYSCRIDFHHAAGDQDYRIGFVNDWQSEDFYTLLGSFYLGSLNWTARVPAALVADDRIELLLPKPLIGAGDGAPLLQGDALTEFEVYCSSNDVFVSFGDDAEASGGDPGRYTPALGPLHPEFGVRSRGQDRVFHYSDYSAPRDPNYSRLPIGVPPGEARDVYLDLSGPGMQRARNATVDARIVDLYGEPLAGWSASAPDTVELPRRGARGMPLIVAVPSDAAHGEMGFLMTSFAAGAANVTLMRPVVALFDPAPDRQTLYFHGARPDFVMNTLADDPRYTQETLESTLPFLFFGGVGLRAELDGPFSERRPLRPGAPFVLTLMLSAETAADHQVLMDVLDNGGDSLGYASRTYSIGTSPAPVELWVEPDLYGIAFQAGEIFSARINVFPAFQELTDVEPDTGMKLHLDGSFLELPISGSVRGPQGDGIRVDVAEGPRAFVTVPGHQRAIALEVTNEGSAATTVHLGPGSSPTDWMFRFRPSEVVELAAAETRLVCLEVKTPMEARAGSASLFVDATREGEELRAAGLPLTFHVAEGASLEDSACDATGTRTQGDAGPDLGRRERESPAPGLVLLLLLAMLGVAARRRRG